MFMKRTLINFLNLMHILNRSYLDKEDSVSHQLTQAQYDAR